MSQKTLRGGPLDGREIDVPAGVSTVVFPFDHEYVVTADGLVYITPHPTEEPQQ